MLSREVWKTTTTILGLWKEEKLLLDFLPRREKYFRNMFGDSGVHFKAQVCIIFHSIKPPVLLKDVVRVLDVKDLHFSHVSSNYILIFQKFIYVFIFGCSASSFLHVGFLELRPAGRLFSAVLGLLAVVASLVVEHGFQAYVLSSRDLWVLERGLSGCGTHP